MLGGAYIKFELGFCLGLAGVVTISLNLGVAIKSPPMLYLEGVTPTPSPPPSFIM